jgi:hypothetical protein
MKPLSQMAFHSVQLGFLRSASLLTPGSARAEWLQEWRAELWHLRKATVSNSAESWRAEQQAARFCLGALQDALCMRRLSSRKKQQPRSFRGSAVQCIIALAAALIVSYGVALLLPGVRAESHPALYQVNPNTILIQDAQRTDDSAPTISAPTFALWKQRRQRFFDGLAFYQIALEGITKGSRTSSGWRVAHATPNLLALLGVPVRFAAEGPEVPDNLPTLVLGDRVWRRDFDADVNVAGRVVRVGQREARIAGVVRYGAWRLPGNVDAWLLEPNTPLRGVGFVVGHLTKLGQIEMLSDRVHITANNSDDSDDDLWGVSLQDRTRGPWDIYLLAVILAFLSLPAITSVSLAEYSFCAHKPSWSKRICRWGFLAAKIALLLPIVYFTSLDLSYWHAADYSIPSQYIQLISAFMLCLFGMQWALLDQRMRCPVCLKRVTHPAQVGYAGRTFLAWNGTEMICTGGHTLLHVPALPTSWFSTQRWLYLDNSWEFLFANSGAG